MMMMVKTVMVMMTVMTVAVVEYWPSDGWLIPGLRDRGPPRGPVSVSNIHSIIHPGSSTTSSKGGFQESSIEGKLENRRSPPGI